MRRKNKRLGQNRRNVHVYINWRGCCCCFLAVLVVPPCDCVITIDRAWLWRTHIIIISQSIEQNCNTFSRWHEVHEWECLCLLNSIARSLGLICAHASPLVSVCFTFTHLIWLSIIGKIFLFVIWASVEIGNRFSNRQPIHANAKVDRALISPRTIRVQCTYFEFIW